MKNDKRFARNKVFCTNHKKKQTSKKGDVRVIKKLIVLLLVIGAFCVNVSGKDVNPDKLKMPKIFSDNMVLQRGIPLPVWGWGKPGEYVTAKFKGQEKSVKVGRDGKWMLHFKPLSVSAKGETLTVAAGKNIKEFNNILVGDVWLCTGQSNMSVTFNQVLKETLGIKNSQIRLRGFDRKWRICTERNVRYFSRVGYYFGAELQNTLKIPIGLICISRGGSSIETWMPPESLTEPPSFVDASGSRLIDTMKDFQKFHDNYKKLSDNEKENVFLKFADGYPYFKGVFLKNGKLAPENYGKILRRMTITMPAFQYNSLMKPIVPFGIKGAIWYQGETNWAFKDNKYALKQKALIEGWRKLWNEGDFPFYIVQIAPTSGGTVRSSIWLQQYMAVNATKNSGIITIVDIGFPCASDNVHPVNKWDVGKRLALLALTKTYKMKNIIFSGPRYKSIKTVGNKMVVSFDHTGSGLCTKNNDAPAKFEIAGADGNFVKAKASIDGNTVIVEAPSVKNPLYVRYAWSGKIKDPNLLLYNKEGLPAFPFNTKEPFFQNK